MTYKLFYVRGTGIRSIGPTGNQISLHGRFESRAPKTFKAKNMLVLCEQMPSKDIQKKYKDHLFVEVPKDDLDRVQKNLDFITNNPNWNTVNVCLEGKGLNNNRLAYSEVDYGC